MGNTPFDKKKFAISRRDAERVCDGLELAATWDKTDIYYLLKFWLEKADEDEDPDEDEGQLLV